MVQSEQQFQHTGATPETITHISHYSPACVKNTGRQVGKFVCHGLLHCTVVDLMLYKTNMPEEISCMYVCCHCGQN